MQHLIFYKADSNLIDKLSDYNFPSDQPFTLHFCTDFLQTIKLVERKMADLVFFFTNDLNVYNRTQIVQLQNLGVKVCLFSKTSWAMDAWRLGVFQFDDYPISIEKVKNGHRKLLRKSTGFKTAFITIKTDEGVIKLDLHNIDYLRAAGNYTLIHTSDGKSYIQTKQLGQYEVLSAKVDSLKRVHRSLIINFDNIKSIGKQMIVFKTNHKSLKISKTMESKIKKILLGA